MYFTFELFHWKINLSVNVRSFMWFATFPFVVVNTPPFSLFRIAISISIRHTSYVNTSILQPSVAQTFSSVKYRNRMKLSNEWFSIFIYILKFRNNHAERNGSRGYYAAIVYDLSSPRLSLLIFQIAKTIAGETLNYGDCLRRKKYVLSYKEATRDDR